MKRLDFGCEVSGHILAEIFGFPPLSGLCTTGSYIFRRMRVDAANDNKDNSRQREDAQFEISFISCNKFFGGEA